MVSDLEEAPLSLVLRQEPRAAKSWSKPNSCLISCMALGRSLRPWSLSPSWGSGEPLTQVTGQLDDASDGAAAPLIHGSRFQGFSQPGAESIE